MINLRSDTEIIHFTNNVKYDGPYWNANILLGHARYSYSQYFQHTNDKSNFSTLWAQTAATMMSPFRDIREKEHSEVGFYLYNPQYNKSFWIAFSSEFFNL